MRKKKPSPHLIQMPEDGQFPAHVNHTSSCWPFVYRGGKGHAWKCFSYSPPLTMLCPIMLLVFGFVQSQAYSMSAFKVSFKHQPKSDPQNAVFLIHPSTGKAMLALNGNGVLLMFFAKVGSFKTCSDSRRLSESLSPIIAKYFLFESFPLWETISFFFFFLLWQCHPIVSREMNPGIDLDEIYLTCLKGWPWAVTQNTSAMAFESFIKKKR